MCGVRVQQKEEPESKVVFATSIMRASLEMLAVEEAFSLGVFHFLPRCSNPLTEAVCCYMTHFHFLTEVPVIF